MAQKKAYSRYFIILQEDENGYSLASDKLPSGYTKLETKNDKCKVSYYVQNLKKEKEPYYMMLICNRKDVKKLVKLGALNLDEYGRGEVTYEYSIDNVAGSNISAEVISGAAIVKLEQDKIISIMSGFASAEAPRDWKSYNLLDSHRQEETEKNRAEVKEDKEPEQPQEQPEENLKEDEEAPKEERIPEEQQNIFKEYEQKIEEIKEEEIKRKDSKSKSKAETKKSKEEKESVISEKAELDLSEKEKDTEKKKENPPKEPDEKPEEKVSANIEKEKAEKQTYQEDKQKQPQSEHHKEPPIGTLGEFFRAVAEDFEELKDACQDIKKCKWYKVPVKSLDDMCNSSNYNKYTIAYYPMINYYPYIKKFNHYLLGYKYDSEGKMKYLVYGIPGTRNRADQPYSGKSGFVTWVPFTPGDETEDSFGYWMMFYDFRTSTIVIPVK